jgi:hypothetical protein
MSLGEDEADGKYCGGHTLSLEELVAVEGLWRRRSPSSSVMW